MILVNVVLHWSLAYLGSAHARSVDLVEAPRPTVTLSEAQTCERQLVELRKSEMIERLRQINRGEGMIQNTLDHLQDVGEITTQQQYDLARAQLTIGPEVLNEVLLPEAVYQVFNARYGSPDAIRRALSSFKDIASPEDQSLLLNEIIERILQFITDVGADNLSAVPKTAAFLGMNPGQLRSFREKWVYYDSKDEFAQILQTGVLYAIVSADPAFTERVLARGGPWRWLRRLVGMVKIPPRPIAPNPNMDLRQIQVEDVAYYDTDDVLAYLARSSTAARLFFVSSRLGYLTRDQLDRLHDRRRVLKLKSSLVATLESEMGWRDRLKPKWTTVRELDRDRTELKSRIARAEDRHVYDQNQVFEDMDALFKEQNATAVGDQATAMLKNQVDRCDEVKFARLVGKIIDRSTSRFGAAPALALRFVDAAVGYANAFNLTDEQLSKVQLDLTKLANTLPGRAQGRARALVQRLVSSRPKFQRLSLDELGQQLTLTEAAWTRAKQDLDEVYRLR